MNKQANLSFACLIAQNEASYQEVYSSTGLEPWTDPTMPLLSSICRKLPWQPKDAKRSRWGLEIDLEKINEDIGEKAEKLKPSTSYDSDFWRADAEISRLCQLRAGMRSRLQFLDCGETSSNYESENDWLAFEQAQNPEHQILAYRQAEELAKK